MLSFLTKNFIVAEVLSKSISNATYFNEFETVVYCVNTIYGMPLSYNSLNLFIVHPSLLIYDKNLGQCTWD